MNVPPPVGTWDEWVRRFAAQANGPLSIVRDGSAAQDGLVRWDREVQSPVFPRDGAWVPVLSWVAVPGSASASGTAGQAAYDGSFVYICVSDNTWVRAALSTW